MTRYLLLSGLAALLGAAGMATTAHADCSDRPPWVGGPPCPSIQPPIQPAPLPPIQPVLPLPNGPTALPNCAPGTAPAQHPDGTIRCDPV